MQRARATVQRSRDQYHLLLDGELLRTFSNQHDADIQARQINDTLKLAPRGRFWNGIAIGLLLVAPFWIVLILILRALW